MKVHKTGRSLHEQPVYFYDFQQDINYIYNFNKGGIRNDTRKQTKPRARGSN